MFRHYILVDFCLDLAMRLSVWMSEQRGGRTESKARTTRAMKAEVTTVEVNEKEKGFLVWRPFLRKREAGRLGVGGGGWSEGVMSGVQRGAGGRERYRGEDGRSELPCRANELLEVEVGCKRENSWREGVLGGEDGAG